MLNRTHEILQSLAPAGHRLAPAALLALLLGAADLGAQDSLPRIWDSPAATTSQTIGLAEVSVSYHRPAVKGREIFGDGALVPYGQVWRAGANDNTTIRFSHEATVEGHRLAAGTYGLHTIPGASEWTIIFSNNATSWGSYNYDPAEDALRVTVTPRTAPMQEWMLFEFDALTRDSAELVLRWDELAVPVTLGFATDDLMVDFARHVFLRGIPGFRWQGYNDAANYCLTRGVHLEQGLAWADQSLRRGKNSTNLATKANLLFKLGRESEAADVLEQAVALGGSGAEVNALGYQLLQLERLEAAIAAFERNAHAYPGSWNVHDSLGEAQVAAGDIAAAIASYEQALALVDDGEQRQRIAGVLDDLRAR